MSTTFDVDADDLIAAISGNLAVETIGRVIAEVTVSARMLSAAWIAVAAASNNDSDDPTKYRAITVEFVDDLQAVSLIATDGYVLAASTIRTTDWGDHHDVDIDITETSVDERFDHRFLVGDADARGAALMKYLRRVTKPPKGLDVDVRLVLHVLESSDTPTLASPDGESLGRRVLRIEAPGEVITLPVIDAAAVDARPVLADTGKGNPTGRMAFNPERLKLLAALGDGSVRLRIGGESSTVGFTHTPGSDYPRTVGVIAPLRG